MHFRRVRARLKGSLTLEAAIALPLFLFAMISIIILIECTRLESRIMQVLYDKAEIIASYAYPITKGEESVDLGIDLSEVTELVKEVCLTREAIKSIDDSVLLKEMASDSIIVSDSSILKGNGDIRIKVHYDISAPFGIFKIAKLPVTRTVFMHGWVGYEGSSEDKEQDADDEYVYISSTSVVYHTTPDCTHLNLDIYPVIGAMIEDERNQSGGKYYPCEKCCHLSAMSSGVYMISKTGNRYHTDPNCSGLKRDVKKVRLSEVYGMGACSRCGN